MINETPTEKLIRELREENEQLMAMLNQGGGAAVTGVTTGAAEDDESDELKAQANR